MHVSFRRSVLPCGMCIKYYSASFMYFNCIYISNTEVTHASRSAICKIFEVN